MAILTNPVSRVWDEKFPPAGARGKGNQTYKVIDPYPDYQAYLKEARDNGMEIHTGLP